MIEALDLLTAAAVVLLTSTAVNVAFNDAVSAGLSKVPGVGRTLAIVARELNPYARQWLLHRVSRSAESVVKEVEALYPGAREASSALKKVEAVTRLTAREVGLKEDEASEQVERALERIKGAHRLAERVLDGRYR